MAELDQSTRLAFERTRVAYDRTTMSWIRTATSLITLGFTLYKFLQFEQEEFPQARRRLLSPREFGLIMVGAGLLTLLLGSIEHRRNMRSLKSECPQLPSSYTGLLAALMSLLGVLAFGAMALGQ